MKKYGLIGKTLKHSWSKQWFDQMFANCGIADCEYALYELPELGDFRQWFLQTGLSGCSVTIPYKELVIPFLDELDSEAAAIGAVNCVELCQGRLIGHNTDAPAFAQTLKPLLQPWHTSALILGTGGASKAVAHALQSLGIEHLFVSRNPDGQPGTISYSQAAEEARHRFLIINTTPVGMYPNMALTPWPDLHTLGAKHLCYDLVYNPEETRFMLDSELAGAQTFNGLSMLHRQAQLAWSIWNQH